MSFTRSSKLPSQRPPTTPGEVLLEEFIKPLKLTQKEMADAIAVPFQRLNAIVNGRRAVSVSTALRLAKYLGTSPEVWLDLQQKIDLYNSLKKEQAILDEIKPLNDLEDKAA